MRETEFDILRWFIYGIVLVVLAALSFAWPIMLWIFAAVLGLAIIDVAYTRYFKGKLW
ncbi:MAG: hypothetical protein ACP5IJ_01670 [Candidatus Nanoarchaeia archaeon]